MLTHAALYKKELLSEELAASSLSSSSYPWAEWNEIIFLIVLLYFSSGYSCQVSLIVLGQVPGTTRCCRAQRSTIGIFKRNIEGRKTVKGSEPKPTSKQETDGLDKTLKFRISSSQEKKLIFSGKVAASNRVLGVDHVSLKSKIATADTDADVINDVVDADSKLEPSQCFFLTLTMKAHT